MAGVASHLIDLTDGTVKVLPSNAKNLIVVIVGGSNVKLQTCPDGLFDVAAEIIETSLSAGSNQISANQLHHVRVTGSPTSAEIYYGVS